MSKLNRDHQLDNLKGLAILLVVFSHVISQLFGKWAKTPVMIGFYQINSFFIIPVLAFVSGYLSKRRTSYGEYVKKAIVGVFIPYLLFNILFAIPNLQGMMNVFRPQWTLWYLLSMFFWKIMAEVAAQFRFALPVAVFMALYAGTIPSFGNFLSLSRTICFFPFFLAGYLCSADFLQKLRSAHKAFSLAAIPLVGIIAYVYYTKGINYKTMFMNVSYKSLKQGDLKGILLRAGVLATAFLCLFILINLMTKKIMILTCFGTYSLMIYLGHSKIVKLLRTTKWLKVIKDPWLFMAVGFVLALALCFLFGNKYVAKFYNLTIGKAASAVVREN